MDYKDYSDYFLLTERVFGLNKKKYTPYEHDTAERCYITGNENIPAFLNRFNLEGKKVATVGSSGDQLLSLLLLGASDITFMDSNALSELFIEYKFALIQYFDLNTFKNLLESNSLFHWTIYAKISHLLPEHIKAFWDDVMIEQTSKNESITSSRFNAIKLARNVTQSFPIYYCSFYNDPKEYERLQEILKSRSFKIDYLAADVNEFPKLLTENQDVMLLSNIYSYQIDENDKEKMQKTIIKLCDKLNPGGIIQYDYDYSNKKFETIPLPSGCKLDRIQLAHKSAHHVYLIRKDKESEQTPCM